MADALGRQTGVPVEHSALYTNDKHAGRRMWLLTCRDLFGRNRELWDDEAQ